MGEHRRVVKKIRDGESSIQQRRKWLYTQEWNIWTLWTSWHKLEWLILQKSNGSRTIWMFCWARFINNLLLWLSSKQLHRQRFNFIRRRIFVISTFILTMLELNKHWIYSKKIRTNALDSNGNSVMIVRSIFWMNQIVRQWKNKL